MESLILAFIIGILFTAWIYRRLTQNFDFFVKQGIPGPKPIPIYGNLWGVWNKPLHEQSLEFLHKYGNVYGTFRGSTPCLNICEPNWLRAVLVKNFDHFADRPSIDKKNKFAAKVIAFLEGKEWKSVREVVSGAFTGAKMKRIMELLNESATRLTNQIGSQSKVNMRWEFGTYVADVTGSCLCGTKIDAIGKKDHAVVVNAFKMDVPWSPLSTLGILYPNIGKYFAPPSLLAPFKFFSDLAIHVVQERRGKMTKEQIELDYLGLLLQKYSENKGSLDILGDDEMVHAQVSSLFSSAFDANAHTILTTLHCLAIQPKYQRKVREEIKQVFQKYGTITYDSVQEMTFLDSCFKEALRLYPPVYLTERACVKDFVGPDGINVKKGSLIAIPIYAIHRNPAFYPEPEKYLPERFSREGKKESDPISFLPFSQGPRSCLGMRFGIMTTKVALCHLLNQLEFFPIEETENPIPFTSGTFGVLHKDQVWIGVRRINE